MNDEHGMPVPIYAHGPFKLIRNEGLSYQEMYLIVDGENNVICPISEPDVGKFFVHAVNNIIECREIAVRLAEWGRKHPKCMIHSFNAEKALDKIAEDASKLWTKMQREAKGDE